MFNPLDIFKAVGHFFQNLFGKAGGAVHAVLTNVATIVNAATPIVAELAEIGAAATSPSHLLTLLEVWLGTYIKDEPAIAAWLTEAQTLSPSDVLRSAAALVVSFLVPAGTARSLINLAVELAYNVFKNAGATVALPGQNSAPAASVQDLTAPAAVETLAPAPLVAAAVPSALDPGAPVAGSLGNAAAPVKVLQTVFDESTGQHVNVEV